MTQSNSNLLDRISTLNDLRALSFEELDQVARELRDYTIQSVSKTGGHLGAGLGVVELTIALHYVFNTPEDKLIWDVGHQSYPHKILTGRKEHMGTLRQQGGLSGFTKRSESEFDPFGAGHSSTSISAGLGMAVARDLSNEAFEVIAVIGDGAMSAGMAYEAMNNAGEYGGRLIVVLNDNDMSIAPPVGAMGKYLSRLISSKPYLKFRHKAKQMASKMPAPLEKMARKAEHYAKTVATGGNIFEELGFYYIGPVDGHHLPNLIQILKNIRNDEDQHPILLHVVTEKGKGFHSPEASSERYHAVSKFDAETKIQLSGQSKHPTYTRIFSQSLIEHAKHDQKLVAITAAMPSGTGLDAFAREFPARMFDVGIAEQHAVTFAAGLATQGYKPFVAIYSTFMQRAYDQVIHDVAIQQLPVRFVLDRAGLVGADGPTHAGAFDITMFACLPHMVVMAPSDEAELVHMLATMHAFDQGPSMMRYPRGEGRGAMLPTEPSILPIGKGRIMKRTSPSKNDVAIISLGTRLHDVLFASEQLEKLGINVTVADARFAKPLDKELVIDLARNHSLIVTIEEGAIGGFSAQVLDVLTQEHVLSKGQKFRALMLPDRFLDHASQEAMLEEAGLSQAKIVDTITKLLGRHCEAA